MITKLAHPDLGAPSLAVDVGALEPPATRHSPAGAVAHLVQLAKRVLAVIDRAIFDADGDVMRL